MMLCMGCGNTKDFKKIGIYKEYGEQEHFIDGKTENLVDVGKPEITDSEFVEYEEESLTCCKCKGEDVLEDLDQIKLLEHQTKHTNNTGRWYKKVLLPENQNIKLKKKLVAVRL